MTDPRQKFHPAVQKFTGPLINTALYLHDKVAATFLPTVIKFHYVFNLRDLTNIFQVRDESPPTNTRFLFFSKRNNIIQGMLFARGDVLPLPSHIIRLYVHEATRVYRDKLVNFDDQKVFDRLLLEALRKNISVRLFNGLICQCMGTQIPTACFRYIILQ